MTVTNKLRALLAQPAMLAAPGAYDCVSARAIERAGFSAVYMTGAGTAATLGYPDYGLVTMSEMAANAGRIAASVDVPVIADADTGYGNELNVIRTVREYEKLGVAGMHIEDQGFPKKCGHLEDKEIIARDDYVAKIRAAASAKKSQDFLIIARTDSRAVLGFDEAIAPGERRTCGRRGHGLCRGAAVHGGSRGGAATGQGTMPAEHGVARQDAGGDAAGSRAHGLPVVDHSRRCDSRHAGRRRTGSRRIDEHRPAAQARTRPHTGRGLPTQRRRRMGPLSHGFPAADQASGGIERAHGANLSASPV